MRLPLVVAAIGVWLVALAVVGCHDDSWAQFDKRSEAGFRSRYWPTYGEWRVVRKDSSSQRTAAALLSTSAVVELSTSEAN